MEVFKTIVTWMLNIIKSKSTYKKSCYMAIILFMLLSNGAPTQKKSIITYGTIAMHCANLEQNPNVMENSKINLNF